MGALYKELEYPKQLISQKLADLLKLMLHKDPRRRINKGQIGRIKAHPWCSDINWQAVLEKRQVPPHIPSIFKSNFDPEYVRESSQMTEDCKSLKMLSKDQFEKFKEANVDHRNGSEKKTLLRQRSNAFNTLNISMTSQHSYFYQADATVDITDSAIDQTDIDNVDFSHMNLK